MDSAVVQGATASSSNLHARALSLCQQDVDCDAVRLYTPPGSPRQQIGLYRARAERAKDIGTKLRARSALTVVDRDPLAGVWFAPGARAA